jgi:cytochrome c-type biogenesis protein CcmH/NrfG
LWEGSKEKMNKKGLVVLVVFLIAGGYLFKLNWEWKYKPKEDKPGDKTTQTKAQQTQSILPPSESSPPALPTTSQGIQAEIKKRLSQWYKRPIEEVIAEWQQKLEKKPDDVDTMVKLAEVYVYFPQKHKDALAYLKKAQAVKPEHPKKEFVEFWLKVFQDDIPKEPNFPKQVEIQPFEIATKPNAATGE